MDDEQVIAGLQRKEEAAFQFLINHYHASLVRVAMLYLPDAAAAEEIAQETWLKVLEGIDRFEKRSTLKTWIFAILSNLAKSRGKREGRCIPFSELNLQEEGDGEPSVPANFFSPASDPEFPGHWLVPPAGWDGTPEDHLLSQELKNYMFNALSNLTENQRAIITLHDLEGISSEEICNIFNISETYQRVLLHRGRARIRQAVENYFNGLV